jgi:ribosomal protein S18 acetylase RimI-like enzyme
MYTIAMIRKLTRQDAHVYKQLRLLALTTDPDAYFASLSEEEKRDEWSIAAEISAHATPFGYYGSFDESNVLRAYVQITPAYWSKTQHTADVYNLYVHPDSRGSGVATELLMAMLSSLRSEKKTEVLFLSVMHTNTPAISLYKTLGFEQIGTKKRSVKLADRYVDEILMQINL